MDGASASGGTRASSGSTTPPRHAMNGSVSSSPSNRTNERESEQTKMTTLKMKLPDVSKGGSTIQISLEVGGVLYEGVISASTTPSPAGTGQPADDQIREGTPDNGRS